MAEPAQILAAAEQLLGRAGSLAGRRVLVTAGGTREPLDLVRYLGNRSSGRMGLALAAEALRRGASVTLLAANVALPSPPGASLKRVETAAELLEAALAEEFDVLLMAAAVSDYAPEPLPGKRAKGGEAWTVELRPTPDVLRELARRRRGGQVLVGFAAEAGEAGLARKRLMADEKGVDLVVYNDVSSSGAGFDSAWADAVLLAPGREQPLGRLAKRELASVLLDEVERLLETG